MAGANVTGFLIELERQYKAELEQACTEAAAREAQAETEPATEGEAGAEATVSAPMTPPPLPGPEAAAEVPPPPPETPAETGHYAAEWRAWADTHSIGAIYFLPREDEVRSPLYRFGPNRETYWAYHHPVVVLSERHLGRIWVCTLSSLKGPDLGDQPYLRPAEIVPTEGCPLPHPFVDGLEGNQNYRPLKLVEGQLEIQGFAVASKVYSVWWWSLKVALREVWGPNSQAWVPPSLDWESSRRLIQVVRYLNPGWDPSSLHPVGDD